MTKRTGGPAFPGGSWVGRAPAYDMQSDGMELRDWFAGQALAGILDFSGDQSYGMGPAIARDIAEMAYALADAMLEAR